MEAVEKEQGTLEDSLEIVKIIPARPVCEDGRVAYDCRLTLELMLPA